MSSFHERHRADFEHHGRRLMIAKFLLFIAVLGIFTMIFNQQLDETISIFSAVGAIWGGLWFSESSKEIKRLKEIEKRAADEELNSVLGSGSDRWQ